MSDAGIDREDRQDIADLLVRYATGIDRRDWPLLRSCFTEDCHADYGVIGVWDGADAITTWMRDTHEPCGHTLHRISNIVVAPAAGAGPDHATARAYVEALILDGANHVATRASGYYDDELVRTTEGWKIARRRFTTVLIEAGIDGIELGGG